VKIWVGKLIILWYGPDENAKKVSILSNFLHEEGVSMKQIISLGMLAALMLTAGCHKKSDKKKREEQKKMAFVDFEEEIIIDQDSDRSDYSDYEVADLEFEFDDYDTFEDQFDDKDLAFLDESEFDIEEFEFEEDEIVLAEIEAELEEAEALAWEEEQQKYNFKDIKFAFNESEILDEQREFVEENVEVAREAISQGKIVAINTHSDSLGSEGAKLRTAMKRGETVKDEFVKFGLDGNKLEIVNYSDELPVAFCDEEETDPVEIKKALKDNRRVNFTVI